MIRFRNVHYSYFSGTPVLSNLTLDLESGLILVVGPNGSGKSTLLKLAAGVERPDAGSIEVGGYDLWKHEIESRQTLAYAPEQPDLTPYASVSEIMRLVCRLRRAPQEEGMETLEKLGLGALSNRTVRELSMGQRRRAVMATAMTGNLQHYLLDEPLDAMDRALRDYIVQWVTARVTAGCLVALVTHDLEPFVPSVTSVVAASAGTLTHFKDLPDDLRGRRDFLERAARGISP